MKHPLLLWKAIPVLLIALATVSWAQPTITSTSPGKNARDIAASADITITFSESMNNATLIASTIKVNG